MKPLSTTDPTVIGPYRLLGVLGRGGMGRVYLGQSHSGRPVAVKVIRADLVDDPATRRRFTREVAAARTINPLFTAPVVDADTEAESPWLATTYIDRPSLEQWVDQHGALSPDAVFTLAAGLAEALSSIHGAGLVHRDLKPANVLLADTGPHVIDFGVVLTPHATRVSGGLAVGTPSYMAPECIKGAEAGPPADIFSLGATLVFAATGNSLVESETVYAQIIQITEGRFKLSAVPAELRPLVIRCLSMAPNDRPSAAELTRILVAGGVLAPKPGWYEAPVSTPPKAVLDLPAPIVRRRRAAPGRFTRRRVLAAGGAAGVAALGGIGAWLANGGFGGEPDAVTAPPRPGTVLWQAKSGAQPTAGGPDANRIIPDPARRVVGAGGSEVFAVTAEGRRLWTQPLIGRFVDAIRWSGGVLVVDVAALRLLDAATGRERFFLDAAALAGAAPLSNRPDRGSDAIERVVCSATRAFVKLTTATVALDTEGRQLWRVPAPGSAPGSTSGSAPTAATPHVADATWLVIHSRTGSTVRVALHDAATGQRKWATAYEAPTRPPGGPPPKGGSAGGPSPAGGSSPQDRPPDGPPPHDGPPGRPPGGPPPHDDAWQRSEGLIGADFLALRDGQEIRVLRLSDGQTAWHRSWPKPVATIASTGDLLLVGADRMSALDLATGAPAWQKTLRGARIAASADGRTILAVTGRTISALDRDGNARWQADLPDSVTRAVPDRLTVDRGVGFVTFKPEEERLLPLDIDVIALALDA